jgi:hypothetical protein
MKRKSVDADNPCLELISSRWARDRTPIDETGESEELRKLAEVKGAKVSSTDRHEQTDPKRRGARNQRFTDADTTLITTTVTYGFTALSLLIAFLKGAKPLLVEFVKSRGARQVKLKIGDDEIHIHGTNDVDKAIEALQKARVLKARIDEQNEPPQEQQDASDGATE